MGPISIRVPARLECVSLLRAVVMTLGDLFGDRQPRPSEVDLARWGLAVYEAGTNVVRHAYAGRPDGELRLIIEFGSRSITFRLLDDGSPNPNWPPAEVGYEPGERGNGLFIIREAMDRVDYLRAADGNELCLVANLPGAGVDDAEESLKRDCP